MVEGVRLESVYVRKCIGGSNPPLTAIQITILYKYPDHFLNHIFSIFYGYKKARIKRAFVIYMSV